MITAGDCCCMNAKERNMSEPRFTCEVENSRYTYTYDPGNRYGPPENCWPSDFSVDDYVGGGITIKFDGKDAAWIASPTDDYLDNVDEDYVYGYEETREDDVASMCEFLNDCLTAIEERGEFGADEDGGSFADGDSWEDIFEEYGFGNWEQEIYEDMPDFKYFRDHRA